MDIKQLIYYTAIVEEGNISAAARKLHMSQPPLSAQLKLLERELGVTLINRGPRQVSLTDAGSLFYQRAKRIILLMDSTKNEIMEYATAQSEILRLGTISSSSTALLTTRMGYFHKKYPNIRFEIREGNTYELLTLLEDNIIDAAIVRTPFPTDNLSCYYLEKENMAAVGKKEFFKNLGQNTLIIEELGGLPLIYYRRFEELIVAAFQNSRTPLITFCKNDDARTTLLWAKAGLGIGLVPLTSVPMVDIHDLEVKIIDSDALSTQIAAIHRKGISLSPAAQQFLKIFTEGAPF